MVFYCKFGYFCEGLFSRSFMKIKSSRNGVITLSTTDHIHVAKSYPSCELFRSQVCLLTVSSKMKFSRKFSDLQ